MKRNILSAVLTLYCLLPIAAQPLSKADSLQIEIAQLENALTSIQTDLQEKTLQYNWEITEKYIEYCKKLYKITNFLLPSHISALRGVVQIFIFSFSDSEIKLILEESIANVK